MRRRLDPSFVLQGQWTNVESSIKNLEQELEQMQGSVQRSHGRR